MKLYRSAGTRFYDTTRKHMKEHKNVIPPDRTDEVLLEICRRIDEKVVEEKAELRDRWNQYKQGLLDQEINEAWEKYNDFTFENYCFLSQIMDLEDPDDEDFELNVVESIEFRVNDHFWTWYMNGGGNVSLDWFFLYRGKENTEEWLRVSAEREGWSNQELSESLQNL